MEAQKPKIALYVQRSFGEKLTATFDFIKENPEIAEEIERQVRAHYGLGEDGPQDAEKDVDKAKDVLTDASDDEV